MSSYVSSVLIINTNWQSVTCRSAVAVKLEFLPVTNKTKAR
jgi:hypothetical protein